MLLTVPFFLQRNVGRASSIGLMGVEHRRVADMLNQQHCCIGWGSFLRIVDNTALLLGGDLKNELKRATKFRVAAACFSIYAFEALRSELGKLAEFKFIFTAPTFAPNAAIDRIKKERRQFFIPADRAASALSGSAFEIKLRNKMTQRAVARECAEWIRRKARFKSNATSAPMQQFAHVQKPGAGAAYMPLSGYTTVDLGY
jgi:hypothetical protein